LNDRTGHPGIERTLYYTQKELDKLNDRTGHPGIERTLYTIP